MKPQRLDKIQEQQESAHRLYQAIASLKTSAEVQSFFNDLCTPTEIQAMADRWWVVDLVKQGIPYRQIHDMTGVSVTTIGRVARYIAMGAGGYELVYKRIRNTKIK